MRAYLIGIHAEVLDKLYLRLAQQHTGRRFDKHLVLNQAPDVKFLADFGLGLSEHLLVLFRSSSLVTAADEVEAEIASSLNLSASLFVAFKIISGFFLTEEISHEENFQCIVRERR